MDDQIKQEIGTSISIVSQAIVALAKPHPVFFHYMAAFYLGEPPLTFVVISTDGKVTNIYNKRPTA